MSRVSLGLLACLTLLAFADPLPAAEPNVAPDERFLDGLSWRCIGPARGGRVSSVAGVRGDRKTYYMGACGGGVWKTTDAGHRWRNVSDKFFQTGSVGAIAVAPSDANVVYVGMGEPDPRGNFSHGDGVYRSTDAGKTWKHLGLAATRQIGRIVVDPRDPDVVFVAALGHVWGPNKERGVYRSRDGGKTWKRVHFVSENAGAVDICFDPFNPRVLFAGFWAVRRKPWRLDSGGAGSGLWRSQDGGDTWHELKSGLPGGVKGKVCVSASAARRDRVFAMVEAENGGLFRSDNGGDSWSRVNQDRKIRQRAWYYSRVEADPQHADTVYVLNVQFHKSVDGGRTFRSVRTPHVDNHALWIDPDDNQRMVEGNDGGANVSDDGGRTWSRQDNQPTAQFYRVTTDNRFPYRVLGSQQDNSTMSISHTSHARNGRDFYAVGGGESGYIAVRPDNPDIIYGGSYGGWMTRYDRSTETMRPISPWPENAIGNAAASLEHRFQWTFPIVLSPHDPNVLYVGAEVLFRSTDEGQSWETLSPDLTTNDRAKQKSSGGPITQDNTTVEYYCTIFTIAESPRKRGRIWVGTDDGRVHVTDDYELGWKDVTPKGLGPDALISLVEASPHDSDAAFLAVTRYRSDDFRPLIYHTRDRGATWALVVRGIPDDAFVRSIREDPERAGLLYAATETGVWMSFDAGQQWMSLQRNLPRVPVTDVAVKGDDLVISTQGRSFWVLSGLSRLRQVSRDRHARLLAPPPAWRGLRGSARIHFDMPDHVQGPARLEFLETVDGKERVVNGYTLALSGGKKGKQSKQGEKKGKQGRKPAQGDDAKDKPKAEDDAPEAPRRRGRRRGRTLRVKPGMNVHVWNMRRPAPTMVPGSVGWPQVRSGPQVLPGRYTVRLTLGKATWRQTLEVRNDPRRPLSDEDLRSARAFSDEVFAALDGVHKSVNTIRDVRSQLNATMSRARKAGVAKKIQKSAKKLGAALRAIEDALIQSKSKAPQDPLNYPVRLNDKLAMLLNLTRGDPRPTDAMRKVLASLKARVQKQQLELELVKLNLVPAFNELAAKAPVPALVLPRSTPR